MRTRPCSRGAAVRCPRSHGSELRRSPQQLPSPAGCAPPCAPGAPCPLAPHARLLAPGAPAPSSFPGEPTFTEDSVPIEPPSPASQPPRWDRICGEGGGTPAGPFPTPLALAPALHLRAQFCAARLIFATRDLLPASPGSSHSLGRTGSSSGPKVAQGAPAPLEQGGGEGEACTCARSPSTFNIRTLTSIVFRARFRGPSGLLALHRTPGLSGTGTPGTGERGGGGGGRCAAAAGRRGAWRWACC